MSTIAASTAIGRIVFVNVYVQDLEVSRAFYGDALGLRVVQEDADSTFYDGGQVMLALRRAGDHGIPTPATRDGSADIVFLTDDLVSVRQKLQAKGVEFLPTSWYGPGGMVDFYDPDQHWLTLYQPSEEAMSWPSADRIRAVMRARSDDAEVQGADQKQASSSGRILRDAEIIYLFAFVEDPEATERFYHVGMGLESLEGGPCSQTSAGDVNGVVKYDTGGIIYATHFIEPERPQEKVDDHACPPKELDLARLKSVTVTFHVDDIEQAMAALSARGVAVPTSPRTTPLGRMVSFDDPTGHVCELLEPALDGPDSAIGAKLGHILGTPL